MPYALSTTKRKFHSILDSISNPSSTSLNADNGQHYASTTTIPPASEPSAKKLRLARPASTSKPSSSFASIRSASNRSTTSQTSTASTMTEEKNPPNFAPWDRNQFLSRLETFRHVDRWVSKSDPINEVQWAKRGWRCVGKETVSCVGGCGNEVMISLEPSREEQKPIEGLEPSEEAVDDYYDWREEAQNELVQRYMEMIVTEHDVGCLWRRKGCDDNIYRLPLAHQATTLRSLRDRYESLSAISSDLPSNISTPKNLNVSKLIPHLFHILYPESHKAASNDHPSSPTTTTSRPQAEDSNHPTINPRALTLALLGWQTDQESTISGIATCTTCFRRLGFWLFKSPPSSPAASPTQPSSPLSLNSDKSPPATSPTFSTRSDPIINRLDPIGEHRDYCPWINPRSQSRNPSSAASKDEDLPGWEILRNMVMHLRPPGGLRVPGTLEGNITPAGRVDTEAVDAEPAKKTKEEKDKERWARLKRLKQVFKVRRKPKVAEMQGGGTE
ncbi:MAG: hypothetical protein Q9201_003130 [Fulgogasparrea decipioides]